jgi:hypothetical protein
MGANLGINISLDLTVIFAGLFKALVGFIGDSIKEKEAALKIFKGTAVELDKNISTLDRLNPKSIKSITVNAPEFSSIINNDIKTAFAVQFLDYVKKFPELKKHDKNAIIQKLYFVTEKVDELRDYAAMTDNQLKTYRSVRIAVRLRNIKKEMLNIKKLIIK